MILKTLLTFSFLFSSAAFAEGQMGLVLKKIVENIHMNRDKHKTSCISAFPNKESTYSVRIYRDGTQLAFENQGEAGFYCKKKPLKELYRLDSCLKPKVEALSKYSLELQRRSRSERSPLRHYIQIKDPKKETLFNRIISNIGAGKAFAGENSCDYKLSLVQVFPNEKGRVLLGDEDLKTEGTYCFSCQR